MALIRICILLSLSALLVGCQDSATVSPDSPVPLVSKLDDKDNKLQSSNDGALEPDPVRGKKYRNILTEKALRGLDYSTGKVTIDRSVAEQLTIGMTVSDARSQFELGRAALESGNIIVAIEKTTRAIILDNTNAEYFQTLGESLFRNQKIDMAEAAFRTSLDHAPDSVPVHQRMALILSASLDRLDESESHYLRVLELDPENGESYSRLAVLNYYRGRNDEAKRLVRLAEANGYAVPPQFIRLLNGAGGGQGPAPLLNGLPTVGVQTRVDISNNAQANETTCSASDADASNVVAGWNDYGTGPIRSGFSISNDGGGSWQDVLLRPPAAFQGGTEGDPMTCADNRTGDMWAGAISFDSNGGVYVARLNAGDSTFQPSVMALVSGISDKCWMEAGVDPNDPSQTRLYIGLTDGGARLLVSEDAGDSWSAPIVIPAFGLGWLPRVGPNGELYLSVWDFAGGYQLIRSLDGGATFEGPFTIANRMDFWSVDGTRFPGRFRVAPLVTFGVDPNDGTLYAAYADTTSVSGDNRNVDVYFTRSIDQGTTWTTPTILNTDAATPGDQFFPFVEVDNSGRVHVVFYDTRAVIQNDNTTDGAGQPPAMIEAWYAFSDDAGDSWTELVLTDQPFSSADDGFNDGFIGDYLGIGVSGTTVYPCYMSTHEGIANIFVHEITNDFLVGDINRDGIVNLLDIQPFVDLLAAADFDKAADINGDGSVNLLDVAGFVELIIGGN